MKKYITLILVFSLCLGLTACGGKQPVSTEPSDTSLLPEYARDTNARFLGEWFVAPNSPEEAPVQNLSFSADGTCTVDNQPMTWEVRQKLEDHIGINILKDGKLVYYLSCWLTEYGYHDAELSIIHENGAETSTNCTYYKTEEYQVINLSDKNLLDYFDMVPEIVISQTTALGALEYVRVEWVFRLKAEYGVVNTAISSASINYTCLADSLRNCTFDSENMVYEMGEVVEQGYESMGRLLLNETRDPYDYFFSLYYFEQSEFPGSVVYTCENYAFPEVSGVLYCLIK